MTAIQDAWDAYQQAEADVRRTQAAWLAAQRAAQQAFARWQREDRAELDRQLELFIPEEPSCS